MFLLFFLWRRGKSSDLALEKNAFLGHCLQFVHDGDEIIHSGHGAETDEADARAALQLMITSG